MSTLEQATEWFMRLRDDPVDAETIAAWSAWRQASPDNARAYGQVQSLWSLAGQAGPGVRPSAVQLRGDVYTGAVSVQQWRARIAVRWRRPAFGLAAALVLVLLGWQLTGLWTDASGDYSSQRGEKRQLHLQDGSVVTLGGASKVRVAYGHERRELWLQSGEALFEVKRDKSRPFVVSARDLKVTAIGTAFVIRADDTRTVVSVTDGVVEIGQLKDAPTHMPAASLRYKAGEQVTFDTGVKVPNVRLTDTSAAIGWQDGALTYVDEPLRSVVARINRYSKENVVLGDAELGKLRFTGTLFENQVQEWAQGLEQVFPLRAVHRADGLTLERRK